MATQIVGLGALEKRLKAIASPAAKKQYLGRLGLSAVREAKHLVARKTGNTGRTIRLGPVSPESVTIEASGAAPFLEHGTRPHIIRAKRAKALRWAVGASGRRLSGSPRKGADVAFAAFVRHPGTKAQPFMRPGAEQAIEQEALADFVVETWNRAA